MKALNIFILLILSFALQAQNSKALEKANKAYKLKNYAQAIPLYEKFLSEKSNNTAKAKLANCYFYMNNISKAKPIYEELVAEDKVKSKTIFNYAQTLVYEGNYDEAKSWFKKYKIYEPDDLKVDQHIKSCDAVKSIQPYFEYATIDTFLYNSEYDDNAPVYYKDGIVFSSDRKSGVRLLKGKSGWTGRDHINIFYSPYRDSQFQDIKNFSAKLNAIQRHNATASFTKDYSKVFFTRNSSELSKKNAFNMQLYSANAAGSRWKNVKKMDFCSHEFNYMHPSISPDGKSLFFVSNKSGGEGGMDLFVSHKKEKGWGKPKALGPTINTSENEGFPYAYRDSLLFFCSKGHSGFGGFDIFVSQLDDEGTWSKPINVGAPINSPSDDISLYITLDGEKGLFTSARSGGDDDIFLLHLTKSGNSPMSEMITKENVDSVEPATSSTPAKIKQKVITQEIKLNDPDLEENIDIPDQQFNIDGVQFSTVSNNSQIAKKEESPRTVENTISVSSFDQFINSIPDERNTYILKDIAFQLFRHDLTTANTVALDKYIMSLLENDKLKVEIGGHTSSLGDDKKNTLLSQYRAEAVYEYFVESGVPKDRLQVVGYGETQLLNDCANGVACTQKKHFENERIELKILESPSNY